ncbi:hypothetical protein STAS_04217 [Striga asiatica]|uniref:Uncharacterized protein n=1 Tax=Striga asiatica TaxID=4170 RepID=A0A5A7P6K9_STRAF|nr:hypothetical protein STAS_04217 [Striga asiatica]
MANRWNGFGTRARQELPRAQFFRPNESIAVVKADEEVEVTEDVFIHSDDKEAEACERKAIAGDGVLAAFAGGDDHDAWGLAEVLRLADVLLGFWVVLEEGSN